MRKLYTLEELKSKYEPDKIISAIEENFVIHKFTLINLFSIESCPLSKYKQERQLRPLITQKHIKCFLLNKVINIIIFRRK